MPITLPDSTKFDADTDRLDDSRPELKKISDAINTLATEWNANGETFGDKLQLVAGTGIALTTPDSAGEITITNTAVSGTESFGTNSTTGTIGSSNKVTLSGDARVVQISVTSGGGVEKFGLNVDNCDIGVTYIIYVSGNYGQITCRLYDNDQVLDSTGGSTATIGVSDASDLRWAFKVTKVATSNNRFFAEWDGESRVFDI